LSRRRRRQAAIRRWKERAGYYRLQRKLRRRPFERALRSTDAFIVGHPKSGNTWLAYMLAVLLFDDADGEVTLANVGAYIPFVHGHDHRIARHAHLPDPRVFRNEDPKFPGLYPKTIFLVRDPRAALVSLWRMYQTMFGDTRLGFGEFLEQYLRGDGIFDWWNSKLVRWDRQVAAALDRVERDPDFLVVSYEEMVRDRGSAMRRIVGFLPIEPPAERIEQAVARGAFDSMRSVEDAHGAEAYRGRAKGEGRFVRVGRIDGWRDEIDPSHAERIAEVMGATMRRAGYA
jgi:hypothetical protein